MLRVLMIGLAVAVLSALSAPAQDVDSGPKAGEKVPKLEVYDATGENKEKTVDYAGVRKDKPTLYIFVHEGKFDRPPFRFMKGLDEAIKKLDDVYGVAVWVTDDED